MNKEILFRAKAINRDKNISKRSHYKNGDWVYGLVTRLYDERFPSLPAEMTDINGISRIEVDYKTIGQYTGLTDKNEAKIFEGDVVKCTDTINDIEFIAVVEFGNPNCEYSWGYQLNFISGDEPRLDILCWVDTEESGTYIEVIGNIYDNPELMNDD